ncbi:MAG: P22 phage major capsid protein family protein, partial [Haliea sp.]
DLFIRADKRGDGGSALETARLGHILGFDTYLDVNVNSVDVSSCDVNTSVVVTNALAAGSGGSQTISGGVTTVVGEFITVAGNMQPTYITATGGATDMTLNEVNKFATLASAATVLYRAMSVENTAGYAAGWVKEITIADYTTGKPPVVGQLIAFGTGGSRKTYTVIESTDAGSTCDILLDRPLEIALADEDLAFPGPAGAMNWAMHRECLALVTRPLALPPQNHGVMSGIAVYNDLAMRVVMQYDSSTGGTRVNLDILAGLAQLDEKLAVALLG